MARLTVQAFANGKPVFEGLFTSAKKSEQEMADWMHEHRKPGIELKFLGMRGFVTPREKPTGR